MTIAVSGASGFLGSALIKRFSSEGRPTIAIGGPHTKSSIANKHIRWIPYLSDYSELAKAVASTKPEVIVHCATHYVYSHEPSDIAPMFDANLHFGTHILEALRTSDAQFVNISTYFQHQRTAKGQSTSIYAISKSAFSSIVQWYGGNTALKITDLTLFDTYGPGDERKKLIPNLLACARSGTTLELRSASAAVDLCYVDDVVAAIDLVVSKRKSGSWSVRSGHPITVADIARTTEEITGRRVVDKFSDSLVVAGLPMEVPPMLPGWRPNVELREGIARCWQAVKDDA